MLDSPEEAASLLRGPPSYDDSTNASQGPVEEFEISEPEQPQNVTWLSRMTTFGKRRIYVPVRHIIDPIAHLWHSFSLWTDAILGRYINPLLAKRLIFVVFTGIIIGILYWSHGDKILGLNLVHYDHKQLRDALKPYISADSLRERAEFFGQMPHYAGSVADQSTALFVHDTLQSLGMHASYNRHDVFLSHGNYTHCELLENGSVIWESELLEGQAIENPTVSQQQPRTQMALVLPGEAEGPLIYINFGTIDDISAAGDVEGKIGLVKYGHEDAGTVAMRAQNRGLVGLIFFSSKHPTEPMWPDGRDYPADAVQQGSLAFPADYPGDILSPGWPSSMQMVTDLGAANIAHIPAAAASWNDVAPLIRALAGQGRRMDTGHQDWGNNGMPPEVEWWTGPSTNHTVRLVVKPEAENRHQITNVLAQLPGRESSSRTVVIGARLDAMCYGSSQTAGLAVLLEVARAFANLRYDKQWEPLRSIFFAAWDGTAHNFAGSTEWVESVADSLSTEGVAYIDLDLGVSGPRFVVQGHPMFEVEKIMKSVEFNGATLWDAVDHEESFRPIPGYGNHIAFQSHTGVPSLRAGFLGNVVPVDSCFDSMDWMHRFGDPGFERHRALAEFVTALALEISDSPILPFDVQHFGDEIHRYATDLEERALEIFGSDAVASQPFADVLGQAHASANAMSATGADYRRLRESWDKLWAASVDENGNFVGEAAPVARFRMLWNEWVTHVNKAILDRNGIAHRNWYKHHLFGPEYDYEYDNNLSGTFPSVRDGLKSLSEEYFIDTLRDAVSHILQAATSPDDVMMM